MDVSPAEATNTNVGGQARPTRHDSENKVEDNQVGERLEKIQETTRREKLTPETQALKTQPINRSKTDYALEE